MTECEREALIIAHMPLAEQMASNSLRMKPKNIEFDDMAQAAYEGLIDAANRYTPSRGVPFSAYAHWRIMGSMVDYMRSIDWVSKGRRGKEIYEEVIYDDTGLILKLVEDEHATASIVNSAQLSSVRRLISSYARTMTDRDFEILVRHVWIGETMISIGASHGLGESRVSQILTRIRGQLAGSAGLLAAWRELN